MKVATFFEDDVDVSKKIEQTKAMVRDRINSFHAKTGRYPDRLYVGMDTWNRIKRDAVELNLNLTKLQRNDRPEYCGLAVYRVDAAEHLNVG